MRPTVTWSEMMSGVKVIRKQLYSKEERIARALSVLEKNAAITLGDYAYINDMSRTAASLELKEITQDPTSPIRSIGRGSHKVWVKKIINKCEYLCSYVNVSLKVCVNSLIYRKICNFAQLING